METEVVHIEIPRWMRDYTSRKTPKGLGYAHYWGEVFTYAVRLIDLDADKAFAGSFNGMPKIPGLLEQPVEPGFPGQKDLGGS